MKLAALAISTLAAVASAQNGNENMSFREEESRQLRTGLDANAAVSITSSALTIADSVKTLANMYKKDCHQLACWIAAPTYDCAWAGANQAQSELMKGRNSFAIESSGPEGMWVRYWRTQFTPPDRGEVARAACSDGNSFVMSNCQQTGKVYC